MKKTIRQALLILLLAPFVMISCNNDDDNGAATITFNSTSNNDPYSDNFHLSGKVNSDSGTEIEQISIIGHYRELEYEDANNPTHGSYNYESMVLAQIGDTELRRVNDNEYDFYIDKTNTSLYGMVNTIYAIEVTAQVKKGDRSSRTWNVAQLN